MWTTVTATVHLPGFHHFPNAATRFPARGYLEDRHRHLFGLHVEVYVGHDDRHIEFHELSDLVREWWNERAEATTGSVEWGAYSCEAIARALHAHLTAVHSLRPRRIAVDEDGEHTATLYTNERTHPA